MVPSDGQTNDDPSLELCCSAFTTLMTYDQAGWGKVPACDTGNNPCPTGVYIPTGAEMANPDPAFTP